jgi:hypothetical protein
MFFSAQGPIVNYLTRDWGFLFHIASVPKYKAYKFRPKSKFSNSDQVYIDKSVSTVQNIYAMKTYFMIDLLLSSHV